MRMWSGRMEKDPAEELDALNSSLPVDRRLVDQDIRVSQAWVKALAAAGALSGEEEKQLIQGLASVREVFESGQFEPQPSDEDIHTAVERLLAEEIGSLAEKLHTGRSRNDQVATDFRLWVIEASQQLRENLTGYASAVLTCARSGKDQPMPGYTHLQQAQPVTWDHWLLAHFWALMRDRERFDRVIAAASVLPLGSAALAGSAYPIDRQMLAAELEFSRVSNNSLDAVSDRDFALEFLFAASVLAMHISRFAGMLIVFNTREFNFIEMDDAYATGSSLMPQKKNPDALELARAKSGRISANLTALLSILKGLPSAYDKDLQEDKALVFEVYDTLDLVVTVMSGLVSSLKINPERMSAAIQPDILATDLADHLVGRGVPFRQAHRQVSHLVRLAAERGISLMELSLEDLRSISADFDQESLTVLNVERALEQRALPGGTSSKARSAQLEAAQAALDRI